MPSSQIILEGLRTTANHWVWLAVVWHVAFGAALAAVALGWRPDRRLAGGLCAIPLASVSVLAWMAGNPFNGTVFAILAAGLVVQAMRLRGGRVELAMPWGLAAGGILAAFGWTYPHFLEGRSWAAYL